MSNWPKWLRIIFIVSGTLFVLAVLFSIYVSATRTILPPLSMADPSNPGEEAQPTNVVVLITAVTGLVTAVSGLYGQILAGRKMKLDYDLAKRRLEMEERAQKAEKKG